MAYDPEKHHRRSIRLKNYDYTRAGAYFVTICTQGKVCLFGDVVDGVMQVNENGQIVLDSWQWMQNHYDYVLLDEYIVMPNHFHAIVTLTDKRIERRGGSRTAPTQIVDERTGVQNTGVMSKRKSLGQLIGAFKTVSTKRINALRNTPGIAVWLRNYYERIVRDEQSLKSIREYIIRNPSEWAMDRENPAWIK